MQRKRSKSMNNDENESNLEAAYEYLANLDELPKPELAGHQWRQEGTQLKCMSCPFTHAWVIGTEHQLYGIDDRGYPLIRKLEYRSDAPGHG